LLALASCGGGTGGTGAAGGGSTPAVSTGVMTKGSTIVNGVRFEDTTANIFIDDTPKTAAALQNGMVVKVLGTVNDDGINGTAQRVKALIEVRGLVSSVNASANPQSFVVFGQTVLIDDLTVLNDVTAPIDNTLVGILVEVHGLRDTNGQVRATRVEANTAQMGANTVDEIRGVVSGGAGSNPTTFSLGSQAVSASGAVIAPAGASYQNGSVVEVHCTVRPCAPGGIFQASRVVVEDSEDSAFRPSSGQRLEAEGLISGFTLHPGDFSVAGTPVTTTASTRFEGGISTDLADNIKVEAEGSWNGTRLVASKIEFKRSVIRLQGEVTAAAAPSFTLTITGAGPVTVQADSLTTGDFAGGAVPPVASGCVQVRGQRKAGGGVVVTAGEIRSSCSSSDRHFVQAPVEAEAAENTVTLLGFILDVSNPTDTPDKWVDVNDVGITRTAFFNAVTPATTDAAGISRAGTLVKVIFDSPGSAVRQVELED